MRNISRTAAAVLMFAVGTAYAAALTPPVRRITAVQAARAKAPVMSDAQLEKAIRARFAASKISTHHFQVHVQGGVATIDGQTDVLQHKGTATRLAKNAGAVKVVNRVAVSQAAKDKARKNLAAGRRRAQIKRSQVNIRSLKRPS
ncbi:MAG TPA: BON domain-containing protein [Bryobacteraceae bacterium]|nr:BON domain-containing protein [Bryobacteraceae bacterium]